MKKKDKTDYFLKYDIYQTNYPIDITDGSFHSIIFFEILRQHCDTDTQLIFKKIIKLKWHRVRIYLYYIALLYVFLNLFFTLTIFSERLLFEILTLFFNLILIMFEIKIAKFNFKDYIQTLYNKMDLVVLVLIFVTCSMNIFFEQNRFVNLFNFLSLFFINIRTFLELRLFSKVRHLIRTILQVLIDIQAFLIVSICFAYIYTILQVMSDIIHERPNSSWVEKINISIDMALGSWKTDAQWDFFDWLIFLTSAVVLCFIMLNLIIQIVAKTFFNFHQNKEKVDVQEILEMIIDFDKLIYMDWREPQQQYFQFVVKRGEGQSEEQQIEQILSFLRELSEEKEKQKQK